MSKLPISAIVASYNEAHLLEDCLKSLNFCDEIFGLNLSSSDHSKEIFLKYCNHYEEHQRVSRIEIVHPKFIPKLKNKWFIVIDPDERIKPELVPDIKKMLENAEPELACIRVPMFNYFKGKRLKGTVYGGLISFRLLYKFEGVSLDDEVHNGIKLKPGFTRRKIHFTGENFDQHFWCSGYKQLLEKHNRYLIGEGQAQYTLGQRYSLIKQLKQTLLKFYFSFKGKQGYKDGFTGLALSLIAARYEFLMWRSLKKYEENIGND